MLARETVLRIAVVLVLVGVSAAGACGGDRDDAADPSGAAITEPRDEPIVIRTAVIIAAEEGAETIATGDVLEGSTLGGSSFCVGGTILDTHARPDPAEADEPYLIERAITCPEGTMRIGLTPDVDVPPTQTQTGSWTIVGGSDALDGISGRGEMEVVYGADETSPAHETLTGTVTR